MGYRSEEPSEKVSSPYIQPIWWVFTEGDSSCHVLALRWFEAREIAFTELGPNATFISKDGQPCA
jgi:hypothetical protein